MDWRRIVGSGGDLAVGQDEDEGKHFRLKLLRVSAIAFAVTVLGTVLQAVARVPTETVAYWAAVLISVGTILNMIAAWYDIRPRLFARVNLYVATFIVIGVGLLYLMTGTLNLADMGRRIGAVHGTRPVLAALAFLTVGISLKLALFPLHQWLPNAYAFAPSSVSAAMLFRR